MSIERVGAEFEFLRVVAGFIYHIYVHLQTYGINRGIDRREKRKAI